jgi:hypothetical protein
MLLFLIPICAFFPQEFQPGGDFLQLYAVSNIATAEGAPAGNVPSCRSYLLVEELSHTDLL